MLKDEGGQQGDVHQSERAIHDTLNISNSIIYLPTLYLTYSNSNQKVLCVACRSAISLYLLIVHKRALFP